MIEVQSLSMQYGHVAALKDISFKIESKGIVGFLGPNGAGKTTMMRILTTFLYPTSGQAIVNGINIAEHPLEARKVIGYLPENVPTYPDMFVGDFIHFIGRIRGLSGAELNKRVDWVKDVCGLSDVWRYTFSELSKGYKQRTGIAQALIHDPKIIILDEPTSGLDPIQIIDIRKLISDLSQEKTIIFSTHILQEVEALASEVIMINKGKLIVQGSREDLMNRIDEEEVFVLSVKQNKNKVLDSLSQMRDIAKITEISGNNDYGKFELKAQKSSAIKLKIIDLNTNEQWPIDEFYQKKVSLEDVFIKLSETQDI